MLAATSFPLVFAVIGKIVVILIIIGVAIGVALTLFFMRRTGGGR